MNLTVDRALAIFSVDNSSINTVIWTYIKQTAKFDKAS